MSTETQQVSLPPHVAQLINQQPDELSVACLQRPQDVNQRKYDAVIPLPRNCLLSHQVRHNSLLISILVLAGY